MPGVAEYHAELKSSHRHYAWKLGLRVLLLAVDIALIGMVAWIMDGLFSSGTVYTDYWDDWIISFNLIPIGISFIFCAIVIAYQLLRKRPVHPGWEVGVDLLLWLTFATLAGFSIAVGLYYLSGYYNNSYSYNGGDSGYYITAANGTQVWVPAGSDGQCAAFSDCAEEQAYYATLRHRGIVEIVIFALMIFAVIVHFALFVWGCIDTAARNNNAVSRDARTLAQTMIAEMVANGQIPPPQQPLLYPGPSERASQVGSLMSRENSQGLMSPPPTQQPYQQTGYGYYAPVAQQTPLTQQQQQQGSWPLQAPPAAGQQLNEKQVLQANMPPPPRQMPMSPPGQAIPYNPQPRPEAQPPPEPQISPLSPLSPISLPARAESPTIPQLGPAVGVTQRRQSSNSPGPSFAQNGNGWHTPPTQQAGTASASSDALAGSPLVPTRAPGHTASASRRASSASGSQQQSIAGNDVSSRNRL